MYKYLGSVFYLRRKKSLGEYNSNQICINIVYLDALRCIIKRPRLEMASIKTSGYTYPSTLYGILQQQPACCAQFDLMARGINKINWKKCNYFKTLIALESISICKRAVIVVIRLPTCVCIDSNNALADSFRQINYG